MTKQPFRRELKQFLVDNCKWWLGTIIALLAVLVLLLLLTQNASVAPFIYALF